LLERETRLKLGAVSMAPSRGVYSLRRSGSRFLSERPEAKACFTFEERSAMIQLPRLATLVLAVACVAIPGTARGTLIKEDWKTPGDGLLTLDTLTGETWLNLTVTTNQSYNYVESQLGSGGLYAGFHHATYAELVTLQMNAGIPNIGQATQANLVPVQYLMGFVGVTDTVGNVLDSDGFYNGTMFSDPGYHDRFHLSAPFLGDLGISNFYGDSGPFDDNYHDPRVGHWLVSPGSAIPEPGSMPMLATGLVALLWWARQARKGPAAKRGRDS